MKRHPIFARCYARLSLGMEANGVGEHRERMLEGLAGAVIEVGCGNGLNFAHYPAGVTSVLATEPEPYLRAIAERNAARAPVPVEVVDARAEHLPAGDETFDAAVASLVLCSVPDQTVALREIRRVVRAGGELRFYEHVRAQTPRLRLLQRVLDPFWTPFSGGCHLSRDTAAAIEAAGFATDRLERLRFPDTRIPAPSSPHVLGVARRV